jgi:hypothetical protein
MLLVLCSLLVSNGGCGTDRAEGQALGAGAPNNDAVVRPGFGLKVCYVGMPLTKLRGEWSNVNLPGEDPELFKEYLTNRKSGLTITHDSKKIKVIFIYFRSKDHKPFSGRIEGGVSASSAVEDVIHAMGQPDHMSITTGTQFSEHPGAEEISLLYLEKGIDFAFVKGQLQHVAIFAPEPDYDREFWQDIGDTQAYRAIVPKKSQPKPQEK